MVEVLLMWLCGLIGLAAIPAIAWLEWHEERAWYREHERIRRAYHDSL